jgi:hypothetical protein
VVLDGPLPPVSKGKALSLRLWSGEYVDARTFFRDQAATVQWSGRFRPKAATLLFERLLRDSSVPAFAIRFDLASVFGEFGFVALESPR